MLSVHIQIEDHQRDLALDVTALKPMILAVLAGEGARVDELIVYFVDAEESGSLHAAHFDDPAPTDCMSFPLDGPDEPHRILGEVVVCPKMAIDYVQDQGGDPYEEVALYVVHGVLHLLGYDDQTHEDAARMRQAEASYDRSIKRCADKLNRNA